jgi:hypothetical protein
MEFKEIIKPFFWVEHEHNVSFCLTVGEYKNKIFELRSDEGFEGNGYDWTSLALVFLSEKMPDIDDKIKFDPEGSMFCAYSNDADALKKFATGFKNACEDNTLIRDLFSRAELD